MADDTDDLIRLLSPQAVKLLTANGTELIRQIGWDVVRGVVGDVMVGVNLRNSTESLTRRRIAYLNLAVVEMFVRGAASDPHFYEQLPQRAFASLSRKKIKRAEKWLAQWVLGLTGKAVQNVLRDDLSLLARYRNEYVATCAQVIAEYTTTAGPLGGTVSLGPQVQAEVDWLGTLYLANTIGSQTLSIRGSEKSAYGKLFEKLVLGTLLTALGFRRVAGPDEAAPGAFWLSSAGAKRESDATLLHHMGQGVRFDIGFIGRGNTEISLDKVSRFEREVQHGRDTFYLATFIVIERHGSRSRVVELARQINGTVIQMSSSLWPQEVARQLRAVIGYEHPLADMGQHDATDFLTAAIRTAPLESFLTRSQASETGTEKRVRKRKP